MSQLLVLILEDDWDRIQRFHAILRQHYPVLIHSTNGPAAISMMATLQDAAWTVDRIALLGDDWIESYWYPVAKEMLESH